MASTSRQRPDRTARHHNDTLSHMPSPDDDASVSSPSYTEDISAVQRMLSAVSGSFVTSVLITPLDVVRVRLQTQVVPTKFNVAKSHLPLPTKAIFEKLPPNLGVTACCREVFWMNNTSSVCLATPSSSPFLSTAPSSGMTSLTSETCAVDTNRRKTFNSTFDGLRKIARNEGATSLWRGLTPTLIMVIPANVIYFSGYDYLRSNPSSFVRRYISDSYAPLVAGSLARTAAAASISPIEMLRTRMQAVPGNAAGANVLSDTISGLREMVSERGVTSLWRGLGLTMWRDVPFSGVYWWGYETMRNILTDLDEGRSLSHAIALTFQQDGSQKGRVKDRQEGTKTFQHSFIAGATSGAVASILTMPFDVGKTRRQVDSHQPAKSGSGSLRPEDRWMPRFIYKIWKEEGFAGLYRGWVPRTMKVAPACAIMISSYEVGKKMARKMNSENGEGSNVSS